MNWHAFFSALGIMIGVLLWAAGICWLGQMHVGLAIGAGLLTIAALIGHLES